MALQKVNMHLCPNCGHDLAVIDVFEGITTNGTAFGDSYVKCRKGCTKRQILNSAGVSIPRYPLPDNMFLEMIEYARSIGKKISTSDKQREFSIKRQSLRAYG